MPNSELGEFGKPIQKGSVPKPRQDVGAAIDGAFDRKTRFEDEAPREGGRLDEIWGKHGHN